MQVTVDDMLQMPFGKRLWEERMRIVVEGKPRPYLNMAPVLTVKSETGGGELQTQKFSPKIYDEVLWLTGCEKRNSFFCWPCLLLKPKLGLWNTTGVSSLTYLIEGMPKHEESVHHIEAMLQFQGMVEEFSAASKTDATQYNDIVDRNRQILKRLTDTVCYLIFREKATFKRSKGCQLEPKSCVSSLQFLRTFDTLNCNYIEDAIDLINITPKIVNDLVDAIAKTIKLAIRNELQASTYVSIILSDHSKIATKSQISTVLRYIKEGAVLERFVGFMNMGDQKTLDFVFRHIDHTVAEFGIADRFLAVSLDGGILPSSELPKLIQAIKEKYPYTSFVPWCGHDFDDVFMQTLANIKECCVFFTDMNNMKDFFKEKSKVVKSHLDTYVPKLRGKTDWFAGFQFLTTLEANRKQFSTHFEKMLQKSSEWVAEDVVRVSYFKEILSEFRTKFLLAAFVRLANITAPLGKTLKSPRPEAIFKNESHKVLKNLSSECESGFEELWHEVKNSDASPPAAGPLAKKIKIDYDDPEVAAYRDLYSSMVRLLCDDIDCRFSSLRMLHFCHLLSCDEAGNFVFSNDKLHCLMAMHGAHFGEEQLKNEFIVLRTNGKVFGKKTVYELLEFFIEMKLKGGFKNVYRLCEFVLTLPVKPPSEKQESDKFERIKAWSYIPEVLTVQTGDIGIPCIELDVLQELRKSDSFHSDLCEVFYEANKTFDLLYK